MINSHRDQLARQRRNLRRLAQRRERLQAAAPKMKSVAAGPKEPSAPRERRTA